MKNKFFVQISTPCSAMKYELKESIIRFDVSSIDCMSDLDRVIYDHFGIGYMSQSGTKIKQLVKID